jgi:MoxR-like ATPase
VIAGGEGPRLTKQLNEHMFISHFHDPEDGFPNLEELENDADSISSVVKKKVIDQIEPSLNPVITATDLETLELLRTNVTVSVEIVRYIHNIIAFLRLHRAVLGGISPYATVYCDKLVKSLAPLHGLTYVTPSLVALAIKKIYPHRIQIASPEKERSMQWGSDIDAVAAALEAVGPEVVIEDVLGSVEVPL